MATSLPPSSVDAQNARRGNTMFSSPSRAQSTRVRSSAAPNSPVRASSHSRSATTRVEEILPHRDYETSNITRSPSKRSSERPSHARTESTRSSGGGPHRSSSRSNPPNYTPTDMNTTSANNGTPSAIPSSEKQTNKTGRSRTSIPAQSGNWILGKTIGAGSMGKVKLAKRAEGGEEVAVKIVPRGSANDDNHSQSRADRERAEHSKEVRTAREAAIVTLLDHPYICGMRDVVRTNYHWYMLFEYVNGGQMLDYIISHGRLKEKQARKFSRQIASALDYCHRNSIAHRDLKIENILISKTGDIKIIDFGLSNLFAPKGHLKTFCGSLYFAAPELLQAKAYTGPEVDVWSFGIVLYVLVCGKVPFDDQSMPVLHAKIKKGLVDYPSWLTAECRNLISRMLVTDPKQRASLQEIMSHPWMVKGFGSPPENYLPAREPLQLPLDPEVVHAMTGFDFGPAELIHSQLSKVIESEDYQRAVKMAARERETQVPKDVEKKRSFGFDFYKRRSSTTSKDTLTTPSTEALQLGTDPLNAFHPLVSVYYLVREKQARDRMAANPGATSMPRNSGEAPLQLPELEPPKAAYTNSAAYEMPGEKATGGRSRPRARTHGEDEVATAVANIKITDSNGQPAPAVVEPDAPPKKESAATSMFRRFSTRRRSDKPYPPVVTVQSPAGDFPSLRKSFSVRRPRGRDADDTSTTKPRSGSSQPQHRDLLTPPQSADTHRSGKGLGRSSSVNSAQYRRSSREKDAVETTPKVTYKEPPRTSGSDHSSASGQPSSYNEKTREQEKSNHGPKAATMRAKSLGHARRESIQARRARREEAKEGVSGEADQDVGDLSGVSRERLDPVDHVKPVFLKGLFSVSTTSTKPVQTIRSDIIRVLRQLNVSYSEIRGGFSCRHSPSIDLKKVVDPPSSPPNQAQSHRRRISFGGFNIGSGGSDREREREELREFEKQSSGPKTPRRGAGDTSYTNSDVSDESVGRQNGGSSRRAVGETSTHVQSELGGSMILEFEIFIVKVPLLSLHGIQFKRLAGGTWQYKNMADQILRELRL